MQLFHIYYPSRSGLKSESDNSNVKYIGQNILRSNRAYLHFRHSRFVLVLRYKFREQFKEKNN
jgi:hypothetical protein